MAIKIKKIKTLALAVFLGCLFAFFGFGKVQAATEFVSIVDPDNASGTDYTSLNVWESSTQTDLTAATTQVFSGTLNNSVSDNTTVYLCRSGAYQTHYGTVVHAAAAGDQILIDAITGSATEQSGDIWYSNSSCTGGTTYFTLSDGGDSAIAVASVASSGGTADSTAATIDGWTTSATNYIKIWADPSLSSRHSGVWNTSKYRLAPATGIPLTISEENVRIDGVQFNSADNDSVYINGATGTSDIQFSDNIIKGNATASKVGLNAASTGSSSTIKIWNNFIYDYTGSGAAGIYWNDADWTTYIYNNTLKDSAIGLNRGNDTAHYTKNNLIDTTDAFNGTFTDNDANNNYNSISENTSDVAIGTNGRYNQAFTYVDSANDDFHITLADLGARDRGANLYADSNIAVTTDIDNQGRPPEETADSDDFNRANANPISGNWTTGPGCNAMQISSNRVAATVNSTVNCSYWNIGSFENDQYAQTSYASYGSKGPVVRMQAGGSQANFYSVRMTSSTSLIVIKVVDGSINSLGSTITVSALQAGDVIKLEAIGSVLQVFINGVSQGTRTDSTFSSGVPGIWSYYTSSYMDDWEANSIIHFDIGADQVAKKIYRSVGPSASSALDTGSSGTLSISGSTATFAVAPGDDVGVGDAIQYDSDSGGTVDSIAFITERIDSTRYTVKRANGNDPASTFAADSDWSIFRAYDSLYHAERGDENDSIDNSLEDFDNWNGTGDYTDADEVGRDIITSNEQWNIAAYANGVTADQTAVTVDGWTTGVQNYIKIYAPTDTDEVGTSQRHAGKWDTGKYKLEPPASNTAIDIRDAFVKIDGLQINITPGATTYRYGIIADADYVGDGGKTWISNNIIKMTDTGQGSNYEGMRIAYSSSESATAYVWNNIVYDFNSASSTAYHLQGGWIGYWYNNVAYNNSTGFFGESPGVIFAKNNLAYSNTDNYGTAGSVFDSSSTNNLSGPVQTDAPGNSPRNGVTVSFVDETGDDFHLASSDSGARDYGTNLSSDSEIAFAMDIDGETRETSWDIGADEAHWAAINIKPNVNVKPNVNFKIQ